MTLRAQAVEAMFKANGLSDDAYKAWMAAWDRPVEGMLRVLDAAEPFIRAQVIAEVVEWLREPSGQKPYRHRHQADMDCADMIAREFGGEHA